MRAPTRYTHINGIKYFSRREQVELSDKNINAAAYRMDWDDKRKRMVSGREDSIKLLKYSAERGMSRTRMCQIWGSDFVRIVLEEM